MEDMLSRIVDMDERVRVETQKAEQRKADTFKNIAAQKEAIYNDYISRARLRIEKNYAAEQEAAAKKLEVIQKEQKKCLSDMESQYRKYGDKWVSELVKRVISS